MNTKITETGKFEVGLNYSMNFICDAGLHVTFKCIKRTGKTVTLQSKHDKVTKKLGTDSSGMEYIYPYGKYSMAPILRAKKPF